MSGRGGMTVEECVYWSVVAGLDFDMAPFRKIGEAAASRDVERLRKMARFNLSEVRLDIEHGFDDWARGRAFAWWLCRQSIRAIERERVR
jgi:hypothetical protein